MKTTKDAIPPFGAAHGWAAIESAPKDGTRLLLWSERDGVEVGEWSTSVWTYGGAWIVYENRSDTVELKPTHWMRLPEPPNDKLTDAGTKTL